MRQVTPAEIEIVLGLAQGLSITDFGDGTYEFSPPLTPEQEAIAIPLLQNGVPLNWVAGPLPDWKGFAMWRYSNAEYMALVNGSYGSTVSLIEAALRAGEIELTIPLLETLKEAQAVSPTLIGQFLSAADTYNVPQSLIDAWLGVLQA